MLFQIHIELEVEDHRFGSEKKTKKTKNKKQKNKKRNSF